MTADYTDVATLEHVDNVGRHAVLITLQQCSVLTLPGQTNISNTD